MRLHAKAAPARPMSIRPLGGSAAGVARLACLFVLCLAAVLAWVPTASAVEVTKRPPLFTFDGSDSSAGRLATAVSIDIDQANGLVYVADSRTTFGPGFIDKFNLDGEAQPFTGVPGEKSSLEYTPGFGGEWDSVAVESYGPHAGRIHVMRSETGHVQAFSPTGELLWEIPSPAGWTCGLGVDTEGHPWIGAEGAGMGQYENTGSPPALLNTISTSATVCRLDVDASGAVYGVDENGPVKKYVGGVEVATIDPGSNRDVAVDQSSPTGHIFALGGGAITEYDASGSKIGVVVQNQNLGSSGTIAYNSTLDRVYVATGFGGDVKVFGPLEAGSTPALTAESATEVGLHKATLNGMVDPDGLPNTSYRFEWKPEGLGLWAQAPAQALPASDGDIPVSLPIAGLKSNTKYEARLVGINDETGFTLASDLVKFKTSMPPAPTVAIDDPVSSAFAATVSATIDPQEDETGWRVETSTDPACATGFSSGSLHTIPPEEPGPVEVEQQLPGILPATHYCVRISASNGHKTEVEPETFETTIVTSETKEFTTESIPPLAITAYAAPRTDTTARLNGRLNPNGIDATYRFEWSDDGGDTWTAFPDREDTSHSHDQITVSEELTGLSPTTTYSYRFSAENAVGDASPQGQVKTFTTRSTAEMNPAPRGLELVNNPDKGNQHLTTIRIGSGEAEKTEDALSADGEHAGWTVRAGAPGGNSGTEIPFLATRTASGWTSESLLPPADQQVGGGQLAYEYVASSPDFTRTIFVTRQYVFFDGEVNIVRGTRGGGQELLASFPTPTAGGLVFQRVNVSADASHAILVNPKTGLLVDVGSGAPEVVGLMSDDQPPECGVGFYDGNLSGAPDWIATTDASRVYFRSSGDKDGGGKCSAPGGLYVRNRDAGTTTQIAADASFLRTSPDGRTALLTTPEAIDGDDGNAANDVYRWREEEGSLECLTCSVPNAAVGQVRTAEDLSRAYFTSPNQLVAGEGRAGARNLYVVRADGTIGFVAVIEDGDLGETVPSLGPETSRLTPDGRVLLFSSITRPTADPVAASCESFSESHTCIELYRYDDADGSIECLSCRRAAVTTEDWSARFGLALSADGRTAAFATSEPLVSADVNMVPDVYEWRDGVARLVTDGETKFDSGREDRGRPWIRGASADGSSILFSVAAGPLTGFEQDGLANLYVARIGGGFEPPAPAVHCSEESCQGPLDPTPTPSPQRSAGFSGRGNLAQQTRRGPCARKRGKARKRCQSRQRQKRTRAKHHAGRAK